MLYVVLYTVNDEGLSDSYIGVHEVVEDETVLEKFLFSLPEYIEAVVLSEEDARILAYELRKLLQ